MLPPMDRMFGPALPGTFDFTLLFELVMLGIVPAGIVILVTPVYLRTLVIATNQVRPGVLLWAKLAAGIALIAIQLTGVILWHRADLFRSNVALAASIMSFVGSLCVVIIIYITHTFSIQPSAFLSIFLSLTMLFDITMARSYFLRSSLDTLGALQATVASLKFVLAVLEEVPKLHLFRSNLFRPGAGEAVGFWCRSLLLWLNPILKLGFRKTFTIEELPYIGERYDSERLFDRFVPYWKKALQKSKMPLIMACFRTISWQFLLPVIPRLCYVGFSFSRPFFMQRVIDSVGDGGASVQVTNGLIGAFILIFGGLTVSRSIFERLELQAITSVRGILVVAIYDKIQRLNIDELANSAAVTLMTTDIIGVQDGLGYLHATWSSLLELAFGIYVLYTFVGYACFLLFIPTSIAAIGTYLVTRKMARARTTWNAKIESRVAATSNILAQLKSIKAMGLTDAMSIYLQEKRLDEIETSMQERNSRVMNYAIYGFGAAMTPVTVLAGARFWTRVSNPMTVSETFAAYAAIFIAALPLNSLLARLPFYASGYACLMRIEKFLTLAEIQDQRECHEQDETTSEKSEKASISAPSRYAVEMNNVSVTSDVSGPILKDVCLRIPTGSLAMVHGSVGSGKTAFLNALLGELGVNTGTIKVSTKRIAYASQSPWIQNITLQDNIIGPYPFLEALYYDVLYACALDRDIADLPDGDQTMVGTNGCNLSGGQKQRLGLARSLFARSSIFILDDVLSALDADTASLVFQRVCGPDGLLRQWNSTVIMTTNQLDLLEAADLVFELSHQGRIRQRRGHSRAAKVSNIVPTYREETPLPEGPASTVPQQSEPPSVDTSKTAPDAHGTDRDRRHGDLKLYGYLFRTTSILLLVLWVVLTAIAAVMERMPQIFMRIWLSTDAANSWYFAGFAAISFAEIIITSASGAQFLKQIVPKSSAELHLRLLRTAMEATLPFISHTDAGSLLNRFSQDVSLVSQRLPLMGMTMVSMFFNTVVDIGVVASGSQYAPPIIIFLAVILYGIQYFYLRTSRQLRHLELQTTSPLVTHFTETNSGMAHIRALGWQKPFNKELNTLLNRSQHPFFYLLCIQQWLTLTLDFTTFVAGVTLTSIALFVPQSSSDSAIGLALLNLISFSTTASYVIQMWVHVETSIGGLARIKEFCEDTPVEQDRMDAPELPETWPSSGKIDFNCVTANYLGPRGDVRPALNNATISIQHGQKVGISGRTGSGKTSMILALLNLMEFAGSISIDGREIKSIPRHILRSHITTLTQDGVELKGTIRMNVFPFSTPAPADGEIVTTLERVGLWDLISQCGGLESDIVRVRLSHGQKQLLFLARAILHQQAMETKIVLVDEATSSLDSGTDSRVQELMAEAFADCTVLTIAHQRDYVDGADLVVELDSGNVVEVLRRSKRTGAWVDSY